jgi:hypothetical protein
MSGVLLWAMHAAGCGDMCVRVVAAACPRSEELGHCPDLRVILGIG